MSIRDICATAALISALTACAKVRVMHEYHDGPVPHSNLPGVVVVQSGATLYGLAARNGMKVSDLAAWNGLTPPYTVFAGQSLKLAPPAAIAAARAPALPAVATSPKPAVISRKPESPDVVTSNGSASPQTWRWPAEGVVLAHEAYPRSGIQIIGSVRSPIVAAANGLVLYSGSGFPGREELIVIRHANGWVTSYAHNVRRLVGEGQHVRAGDRIAEMGQTGITRAQLSFEMRKDGQPVDPLIHLPKLFR